MAMRVQQSMHAVCGTLLLALPLLYALPCAAQEQDRIYLGLGLLAVDHEGVHEGVKYGGDALGAHVYGGLQLRERVAVEAAFEDVRNIDTGNIPGSGLERLEISAMRQAVTVRGVFSLSLSELFPERDALKVFGIAGVYGSREERDVLNVGSAERRSVTERDAGIVLGAGVTYRIARVNLRTQLQSLDTTHGSRLEIGFSAELKFGR